jgi:Helix-turn-helix domain
MSGQRSASAARDVRLEIGQPFNPYCLFNGIFIPDALARQKGISRGAKMVYGRLARYAGENGMCYPTVPTLAAEIASSERQTQRYLAELEREKLIRRVPRFSESRQTSNGFQFLWHRLLEAAVTKMAPERVTDPSPEGVTELSPKESQTEENQIEENQTEEKADEKRIPGCASQRPRSDASLLFGSSQADKDRTPRANPCHSAASGDDPSIAKERHQRAWTVQELAEIRRQITIFLGREPTEGFETSVMLRAKGQSAAAVCALFDRKFANKKFRPGGRYAPRNQNWFLTLIENEFWPGHLPECPSPPHESVTPSAGIDRGNETIELPDAPRSLVESGRCPECGTPLAVFTDGTVEGCNCVRSGPDRLKAARKTVVVRTAAFDSRATA